MRLRVLHPAAVALMGLSVVLGETFSPASVAAADFYEGKTIKVTVRTTPSGPYDYYGRLLARHMPKYIPGKPNMIVSNLDGAGGLVAANYLYNTAKRDGTEFGTLSSNIAISQRMKDPGVQYDVQKFISLGNPSGEIFTLAVKKEFPISNLTQLRASPKPVVFSASGPGSGASQIMAAMKADGFPISIVMGYSGSADKVLSVVRGEADGTGSSLEGLGNPPGVLQNGLKIIGHIGNLDDPVMKGSEDIVASVTPKTRPLVELIAAPSTVARPFFLPPEVPQDRVAILRDAFKKALSDPELLE